MHIRQCIPVIEMSVPFFHVFKRSDELFRFGFCPFPRDKPKLCCDQRCQKAIGGVCRRSAHCGRSFWRNLYIIGQKSVFQTVFEKKSPYRVSLPDPFGIALFFLSFLCRKPAEQRCKGKNRRKYRNREKADHRHQQVWPHLAVIGNGRKSFFAVFCRCPFEELLFADEEPI